MYTRKTLTLINSLLILNVPKYRRLTASFVHVVGNEATSATSQKQTQKKVMSVPINMSSLYGIVSAKRDLAHIVKKESRLNHYNSERSLLLPAVTFLYGKIYFAVLHEYRPIPLGVQNCHIFMQKHSNRFKFTDSVYVEGSCCYSIVLFINFLLYPLQRYSCAKLMPTFLVQ